MKKIILILVVFAVILYSNEKYIIPDDAIRLRIIPNSNSKEDQNIKLKVKDKVQSDLAVILKDAKDSNTAEVILKTNLNVIDNDVKNLLNRENYNLGYTINYGYNYFPEKVYKGVTYKEGEYKSLVVKLGAGEGDNWWCVLFPPLCLIEADESETDEVEYKFYVEKILDMFNN